MVAASPRLIIGSWSADEMWKLSLDVLCRCFKMLSIFRWPNARLIWSFVNDTVTGVKGTGVLAISIGGMGFGGCN